MKRRFVTLFGSLAIFAATGTAQASDSADRVEIRLPSSVASGSMFVRYKLSGQEFDRWFQPPPAVSSFAIDTIAEGHPASGIKAVLYAPGCAIQTFDLPLSQAAPPVYSFQCILLRSVAIEGVLTRTDRLYGHAVKLQAKYLARSAQSFLGLHDGLVWSIPIGETASVLPDRRFRLEIPDLSQDPTAGAPGHPGEIQIWALDAATGATVAKLMAPQLHAIRTRMGGLEIRSGYPPDLAFSACAIDPKPEHDPIGFARRPGGRGTCEP
jgi:hypothetical protein